MKISVVIPVFNGENTIRNLNNLLKKELDGTFSYEIIMVNDGGTDSSPGIIEDIVNKDPDHSAVYNPGQRMGQHRAILYGIEKSKGDFIVTLDDDLQHDPVYIKQLILKQEEGDFDVVYAVFKKLSHPAFRVRASELLRKILSKVVPGICPYYSPYRLLKRETAIKMLEFNTPYAFIDGYLGSITSRFSSIKAEHGDRAGGKSSYGLLRLLRHAVLILFYYSKWTRRMDRLVGS